MECSRDDYFAKYTLSELIKTLQNNPKLISIALHCTSGAGFRVAARVALKGAPAPFSAPFERCICVRVCRQCPSQETLLWRLGCLKFEIVVCENYKFAAMLGEFRQKKSTEFCRILTNSQGPNLGCKRRNNFRQRMVKNTCDK